MKVLVTGSSGFIGQHLCRALVSAGHDVVGLDLMPPEDRDFRPVYRQCDILDERQVEDVMRSCKPDAVAHLAARTDLSERKNLKGYDVNNIGTLHLIDAMEKAGSVQRCIFTSTQLVCRIGYIPDDYNDFCPSTLYGESKMLMEKLVRDRSGGVPSWCIVRPTTVWGPGMSSHYQRFFRMVARGRYFHVGRNPLWKSYGYVGNVAHQYRKLIEAPAERIHEEVFYLADYQPVSLRNWVDGFQREFGARRIPSLPEGLADLAAKAGDVVNFVGFRNFPFNSFRLGNILTEYQLDLAATERICGSLPCTVEQGIRETVRWMHSLEDARQRGGRPALRQPASEPADDRSAPRSRSK